MEKEKELQQKPAAEKKNKTAGFFADLDILGINTACGFARFENDGEFYIRGLRSFVTHSVRQIETAGMAAGTAGANLDMYRIAVHSLKSSLRGIGAEELSDRAEKLEKAALSGDTDYINADNNGFTEAAGKLVSGISVFLKTAVPDKPDKDKPKRETLDSETRGKILLACENYDINALKQGIESLDAYRYPSHPNLVEWMREQAGKSNFDVIRRRIETI